MRLPRSLQARLGISIGALLTLLWIAAASVNVKPAGTGRQLEAGAMQYSA